MKHQYNNSIAVSIALLFVLLITPSCKKNNPSPSAPTNLATIGLYEYASGANRRIFIPITKVGTQTGNYLSAFDTGSSGLTIDASGLIPANMITSSGITFSGDSVVVNGITITSQQSTVSYGNAISSIKEYGYLAYAPITMGDQNGNVSAGRVPFFLYYKVVDQNNVQQAAHSLDVFGVGPGISYANNAILSPLSFLTMPAKVTSGFKLSLLNSASFSSGSATYVTGLLTIGLGPNDLASTSGFVMHPLSYFTLGGYSSNIPATITYGTTTVTGAQILFDTGNPSQAIIEDPFAVATIGALPVNTLVTITTNMGFKYQYYTTGTANLTQVQNPNNTKDTRTIFAIDFFVNNEFLTDYTNHRIGLKNN